MTRFAPRRPRGRPPYPGTFTPAEQRVLDGLRKGHTYQRIADDLGLSYDTVKYHVSNMLAKAEVENREELVAFAGRPGLRWGALPASLLWIGGAAAAAVFVAFAVLVLMHRYGDEDDGRLASAETPEPTATATGTLAPPATSVPTAVATQPVGPVTTITHVSIPNGGEIQDGWGLVLGNPRTAGTELWLMPGGTMPKGISPSGRYFVWEDELFDGWTGARSTINTHDYGISVASFSPDNQLLYVQWASLEGRVLRLDGSEVARLPDAGEPANSHASLDGIVWSNDSRSVAVTRLGNGALRTDVVFDGQVLAPVMPGGMARWSEDGDRLAVVGKTTTTILDLKAGTRRELPFTGAYPAWSPDNQYLAVDVSKEDDYALEVRSVATGAEVMRILGVPACLNLWWRDNGLDVGNSIVSVPSGEIKDAGQSPPRPPAVPRLDFSNGIEWVGPNGVYARGVIDGLWAFSTTWIRRDIEDWPPAVFLGLGGKDLCLIGPFTIQVVFP